MSQKDVARKQVGSWDAEARLSSGRLGFAHRLNVGRARAYQLKFGRAIDGVQNFAGDAVVNLVGFVQFHRVADYHFQPPLRQTQAGLGMQGLYRARPQALFHAVMLPLHAFPIVLEHGIDGGSQPLLHLVVVAFSGQGEGDLMPVEAGAGNLLEQPGTGLKDYGVGEHHHAARGGAAGALANLHQVQRTRPMSTTSPVTPAICTLSPTRTPYLPIRKKYPATERITFCRATAMPAVRRPAKVASVPSSLAKATATITAISDHTTIRRSSRNW